MVPPDPARPLRVLVVMPSGQPRGGAEETLLHAVRHGPQAGLEITVAFLEEGDLPADVAQAGADVEIFPAGRLRDAARFFRVENEIARLVRRCGAEIVLGWMTKAHIYSGPAALGCGIPAVYFQHGLPERTWLDRLSRAVPAAGGLACSEFVAVEQRKFVRHPVRAVPVSADVGRFREAARVPLDAAKLAAGFRADLPLVGIVGRLQRWKGMHVFIEAVGEALRRGADFQAVVVGGPHDLERGYGESLRSLLRDTGLGGRVRLVGRQDDVPAWMAAMDVVVHASFREPFGLVVVEAMSMGKPVVASVPGGPSEILLPEKSGLLVPSGDAGAMAGAIARFLGEPEFARRCGECAAASVGFFSPERFAARLADALRATLPGTQQKK